ncbi:MAG: hypothetical protein JKY01_04470 [Pseudomonadales bacterium]|nr:hypothetical protein [Pseudomonadales bacterium]
MSKKILYFLLIAGFLQSCYISRNLTREVKVSFNTDFTITSINRGSEGFTDRFSREEYLEAYLDGLKSEFSTSKIIIDESAPEFKIRINLLEMAEDSKTETVSDANSHEDGNTYTLTSLDYKSNGSIALASGDNIGIWTAYKDKKEKIKSRTKKDGSTTHWEKDMSEDEALDLARMTGRRSGARIVNDIHAYLKKQEE